MVRDECLGIGLPRDDVIFNQDFYEDVLNHAHELELTLMVMPVRPLPLRPLREAFVERLEAGLRHVCSFLHPAFIPVHSLGCI